MSSSSTAPLAPESALLRVAPPPEESPLRRAELRLKELLAELEALDTEIDSLGLELERFARAYEDALAPSFETVSRSERLLRRLRNLQDAASALTRRLEQLALPPADPQSSEHAAPDSTSARRAQASKDGTEPSAFADDDKVSDTFAADDDEVSDTFAADDDEVSDTSEEDVLAERENEAVALKRLHRRLARLLHPDLAQSDEERTRLDSLMARVNVAYEAGDRTTLELIAAKVGAGDTTDSLTDEERLAHLERRIRILSTAAHSLRQQRESLRSTATARLHEEASRRAAEGRDYLAETRAEMDEELHGLAQDARARLRQLERAARTLTSLRNKRMSTLAENGKGRKLRAFDPVLESPLVRQGVLRLERQRATPAARELARRLEDTVSQEPWQVSLTLMAFFAEAAGRPPPGLDSSESWAERYELLRELDMPEAPSFDEALTRLPRHLELGMRAMKKEVRFGLQLRDAELLAAVPLALQRADVAERGRSVLSVLGPQEQCKRCGEEVLLQHLLRTRGLDELNGMLCPLCAHVQKSYWLYSRSEGQEALLPHALRLHTVVEQGVRLAGTTVGFQFLPEEREALTAAQLLQRFVDLYLQPYGVELEPVHLRLVQGGKALEAEAPVGRGALTLKLAPEAATSEKQVLELLRSRIERRFRPDATR
ncbi:molecular chaperone DnaJ [Vitiosangium sp. GDMCC 1.1324]|uniref:molecular chaperone DnaJ n=1 Tax=Vitiosangium sp. (strain GDMCC 1.1324) TaxID=2138576 RepID=UPI000D375C6D|nr:molecular chaperone DnaJ [Vitiosangium sp. GDMCC 1.1324]PTL79577.1 molecular chaperone DnaJ [Vitiosangium sp. GDMCC 1.1324]